MNFETFGTRERAGSVLAYWTPERMAASIPEPVPARSTAPSPMRTVAEPEMTRAGYDATTTEHQSAVLAQPAAVASPTTYPFSTVGRLYYSRNGKDYNATACAIRNTGILTAAHCIYSYAEKVAAGFFLFVPASLPDGTRPFGAWEFESAHYRKEWQDTGNFGWDVGTIKLRTGGLHNTNVGEAVGYLGYSVNRTGQPSWNDVGYPSNYGAGKTMYAEEGPYTRTTDGGTIIGKQGTFGTGASGDPWLLEGEQTIANGIHSHGDSRYADEVFSAYFATWVDELITQTLS